MQVLGERVFCSDVLYCRNICHSAQSCMETGRTVYVSLFRMNCPVTIVHSCLWTAMFVIAGLSLLQGIMCSVPAIGKCCAKMC